jgi:hypothetical protein
MVKHWRKENMHYNDSKYSKLGSYFILRQTTSTPKEFNEANVALRTVEESTPKAVERLLQLE